MLKYSLLLLVALALFSSGYALSETAISQIELSKVTSSNDDQTIATSIGARRSLRAQETDDGREDADNEERGMAEIGAKLKAWFQNFKMWITNSKLVQMGKMHTQTVAQKLRIADARRMIKQGSSSTVLYQNKVTPDEYFLALRLDPKVKFIADSPIAWERNPGLKDWLAYASYWNRMQK